MAEIFKPAPSVHLTENLAGYFAREGAISPMGCFFSGGAIFSAISYQILNRRILLSVVKGRLVDKYLA